jgi:hypothetical protein
MIKPLFFLLLFFCSLQSHSQKLVYKSNGTILNSESQKISPNQVRELLKNNQKLLADYNAGRSKKTVGNILLYGGIGIVLGKLMYNNLSDSSETTQNPNYGNGSFQYTTTYNERSSTLYYIGLAAIAVAIPVKIGFSKKIKNVVTDYNNENATGYKQFNEPRLDLITNSSGIGLRMTLN